MYAVCAFVILNLYMNCSKIPKQKLKFYGNVSVCAQFYLNISK